MDDADAAARSESEWRLAADIDLLEGALDRLTGEIAEGRWTARHYARMHLRGLLLIPVRGLAQLAEQDGSQSCTAAQRRVARLRERAVDLGLLLTEDLDWIKDRAYRHPCPRETTMSSPDPVRATR